MERLRRVSGSSAYPAPARLASHVDVAGVVTTALLLGRYIEATARRRTGNVLRSLASLAARQASVLAADGSERTVEAEALRPGDRFVVRAGERIATDGFVLRGQAGIDRSLMTGESEPAADLG